MIRRPIFNSVFVTFYEDTSETKTSILKNKSRLEDTCQFNAKPTRGYCDGLSGIHIIDGSYGKDVKLDGFNMALVGSWPGPVHEGRGKASYYIDDRCNHRQFEALSAIITGKEGNGGPFLVYSSTLEEYDELKRAQIRFQPRY